MQQLRGCMFGICRECALPLRSVCSWKSMSKRATHYDESDQCYPWIRVYCEGDLSCGLDDWEILRVEPYSQKSAPPNSLSDVLVPFIPCDQLDKVATEFLKEHYSDALKITP